MPRVLASYVDGFALFFDDEFLLYVIPIDFVPHVHVNFVPFLHVNQVTEDFPLDVMMSGEDRITRLPRQCWQ